MPALLERQGAVAPDWVRLRDLLAQRRVAVLSGAGLSTASGIPDYRGPGTRARAKNPVQYQRFMNDPEARRRYWARSCVGWPRFRVARPNVAHEAIARLQRAGLLEGVITQNVDRLHQAAGSRGVVELHGALGQVRCMACDDRSDRQALQDRMEALNPGWHTRTAELAPDGDAELGGPAVQGFVVPGCERCGGMLKPDVVFFGESVPRPVVETASRFVAGCEVLLVVGSSLAVFSGYRFLRQAEGQRIPIAIANLGPTRGDGLATVRVDANLVDLLPWLADVLVGPAT